mgnify:CR=1 FL=1
MSVPVFSTHGCRLNAYESAAMAELAAAAGLEVSNGIVVNENLVASDGSTYAIGDCASFPCLYFERQVRLESVPNAVEHGRFVARQICGRSAHYECLPWFWSDQGKLKLQIAGPTTNATEIVTRRDDTGMVSFCFRNEKFLGVECIGRPTDFVWTRKLFAQSRDTTQSELERFDFDLRRLVENQAVSKHQRSA